MFALIKDETIVRYPYSITELRIDNQNVSFSVDIDDETLAQFGVIKVIATDRPDVAINQMVQEGQPIFSDGSWYQTWEIRSLNDVEIQQLKDSVIDKRNTLLSESDWTQLHDATVDKAAWAIYRQSLRDIPQQADFPYNVIWPVTP